MLLPAVLYMHHNVQSVTQQMLHQGFITDDRKRKASVLQKNGGFFIVHKQERMSYRLLHHYFLCVHRLVGRIVHPHQVKTFGVAFIEAQLLHLVLVGDVESFLHHAAARHIG